MPTVTSRSRARGIVRTLIRKHPRGSSPPRGGLTDHLAACVVGRDANVQNGYRAAGALLNQFVDWNEVRVARWGELERMLRPYVNDGRAGEAARRLTYCLQQIFQARGNLDLDSLASASPGEARKFLFGLEFMDKDEANLVLLLGLGDPVMPVDTDILRTGKRLGVIAQTATKLQAQRALETALEGEDFHECYVALREHARAFCFTESPSCGRCPVRRSCRYRPRPS